MRATRIYTGLAALAFPLAMAAQTIDFESHDYKALGVYDTWEMSPFRTGTLQGNVAVVDNHLKGADAQFGVVANESAKILGVQRSCFGSNTFGARIDLNETFELTPTTKYVHVLIHKPVAGRVMLVGLGKRRERAAQSEAAEQFWVLSTSKVEAGKWCDAVFPIKGAGGIDIYSLVVVPDCESPHGLAEDFVAYIDHIEVNSSAAPSVEYRDYPTNYDETQVSGKGDRYLHSIALNGSSDGNQTIAVGSATPQLICRSMLDKAFTAKAGETLVPVFNYSGNWMNGYVYLDRGQDGRFEATLNEDFTIPAGSDIMTYSYVETVENTEGYKSDGSKVSGNARNFINPPAFRLPADLADGFYRMRFKVDWGSVDPAGRNTATNDIVSNGGVIVDVRMNIHGDRVTVSRNGGLNGDLLTEDGKELTSVSVPFGQPFTVVAAPAPDFRLAGIKVRHGHNLAADSLIHGTAQYADLVIPAYLFKDNKFTIPAEYIDGDVSIEPYFVNPGAGQEGEGDYPINFPADLAVSRTDRHLEGFTVKATQGGTSAVRIPSAGANQVYRDLTDRQVSVVPGDEVAIAVDYTGNAMHHYLYVDLDNDGRFSGALDANGVPAIGGELLAYTYYNGRNSLGQEIGGEPGAVSVASLPAFTIPALLPPGIYRARFKTDWNNIDPAGQWSEGGSNLIDENGGYVVDFLLNVHGVTQNLEILSTNGSVNGSSGTALPLHLPVFKSLRVVPTPAIAGFEAETMTIRHGYHFDGPQYVHGNRQWSEYTVPAEACTIPADSIDGDVVLTVDFAETPQSEYTLVFSDEFNAPNGTQPDGNKWVRSPRHSSTWNRWISNSDKVVYVQDGKLVCRAIPNPDTSTDNVPMITGAVQTQGKFGFKYGKIEGRILTNPHTGNFPAFWMMPDDQSAGWPDCGEIDIWEQIDNENKAYHTLHTGYRTSMVSYSEACSTDRYHTFGFEWDAERMTWYLDGKAVGTHLKKNITAANSWPFDKSFYIILNQSVGNGSWARPADEGHSYETRFDWVRVYQKKSPEAGISHAGAGHLGISLLPGAVRLSADAACLVHVSDVAGRTILKEQVSGVKMLKVQSGIYVVNGRKVLVE